MVIANFRIVLASFGFFAPLASYALWPDETPGFFRVFHTSIYVDNENEKHSKINQSWVLSILGVFKQQRRKSDIESWTQEESTTSQEESIISGD